MSTLLCQTLETELSQEIRYKLNSRVQLGAIYPYLLVFNAPAGTFTFELYSEDRAETVFTKTFTSAEIKTALGSVFNYAHVFFPIIPASPVQIESGLYTMRLTASGYSPSPSSFLGWIQQFEDLQNEMEYVPEYDEQNSLAYRIKLFKEGVQ